MKKTISVILCVSMLLCMLGTFPIAVFAAETNGGVTFDKGEMYYADGSLSALPHTFEVMFYMPADVDPTVRAGSIVSTYTGLDSYYFHFDINTTGSALYPRFEWKSLYDKSTSSMLRTFNFKNATIDLGKWNHITVVVDYENAYLHCYKNGEYVQSNAGGIRLGDMDNRVIDYPLVVGNDNRASQAYNFLGKMQSLAIYSDIRSSEQIAKDYQSVNNADPSLLAHWQFGDSDQGKGVFDKSANGLDLLYSKQWLTEAEMEALRIANNSVTAKNAAYSFAVMGDPQNVTEYDVKKGTTYLSQMCKWVADNAKNLKMEYLLTLGDITDNDGAEEWVIAYNAMKQLNGIVDYSVIRGNHDVYNGGTGLDTYFANDSSYMSKYTAQNSGFYKEGSVANLWHTKRIGQTDWMFVNLDFGADDSIVAWANDAIAAHPDHKVIITTHCYLHGDGTTCDDEDTGSTDEAVHNNGNELWAELVSLHKNIVMVLSGHQEFNRVTLTQTKGVNGNTVSQFLIDQQSVDNAFRDSGKPAALITMFYFSEDGKTVSVEQYSPVRNEYYHTINQLTFDMTADVNEVNDGWNGYEIAPRGTGSENDPYLIENGGNLIWMSNKVEKGSTPSFVGKYFKQICDIDLNTCAIKPIGNYYESDSVMSAFGGNYDGNGYTIKNGRIAYYSYNHTQNRNYGDGLFGVIYGAEIKNVRLENIEFFGDSVTGFIVGRAVAPAGNTDPAYNLISGCSVDSNCKVYSNYSNANRAKSTSVYDGNENDGIIGGICGMAYGTTIEKCVFETDIVLRGFMPKGNITVDKIVTRCIAGGIAGLAGANSVIDHCAFTGSITAIEKSPALPYTVGGIVGLLSPSKISTSDASLTASIKITNCYNSGELKYAGSDPMIKESYWGGILGYAPVGTKLSDGNGYLIENCFNLYAFTELNSTASAFVAGIVGKAASADGGDILQIKNCASVQCTVRGGVGCNEYRADADGTVSASSVSTLPLSDLEVYVNEINKVINPNSDPTTPDTSDPVIAFVLVSVFSFTAVMFILFAALKRKKENEN